MSTSQMKKRSNENSPMSLYLRDISKYPLLSKEEERNLLERYILCLDMDARTTLINSNLRLVVSVIRNYKTNDCMDLIQEGSIGLMESLDHYDLNEDVRLSTYSVRWIRKRISAFLMSNDLIRKSERMQRNISKIKAAQNKYYTLNGRYPTVTELSQVLNLSEKVISRAQAVSERTICFYDSYDTNDDYNNGNQDFDYNQLQDGMAADAEADKIIDAVMQEDLRKKIFEILGSLNEEEKNIVERKYGFHGEIYSRSQIEAETEMSHEEFSKADKTAQRKLKRMSTEMGLQKMI